MADTRKLKQSNRTKYKKLADKSFEIFQTLPIPEKIMNIRYKFQQNRTLIGIDEFSFESHSFQKDCNFVEEFWLGKREANPVGIDDAWKCNFCEFNGNLCCTFSITTNPN